VRVAVAVALAVAVAEGGESRAGADPSGGRRTRNEEKGRKGGDRERAQNNSEMRIY